MTSRQTQASVFALSEAVNIFNKGEILSIGTIKKVKTSKRIFYEILIKIYDGKLSSHRHFSVYRENQKWNLV